MMLRLPRVLRPLGRALLVTVMFVTGWISSPFVSAEDYLRSPDHSAAKAAVQYAPSDVEQVMLSMHRAPSDPDRVYVGQDVGGVWASYDSGRSWNTLRNRGLGTPVIHSLTVDPADANIVYALCGRRAGGSNDLLGIYRTLDGGLNWTQVMSWGDISEPRGALSKIACAPSTIAGGRAQRIYVTFDSSTVFNSTLVATPGLVRSDDGGNSFQVIRDLPAATFGTVIRGSKVDPTNADTLYLWGSAGVIRIDDAGGAAQSVTNMNVGGLPATTIYGDFHISPDGQTLIVGVQSNGVWKSTDRGASWTRIYAWANARGAWVNPGFPEAIYVPGSGQNQVRVSKDGGATWITNVTSTPMPGENNSAYQTYIGYNEPNVSPDPRSKDEALAFANARFYYTANGGSSWVPSNDNFCGAHHKNYAASQIFDPTNPQRYVLGLLDKGLIYTTDGGRTFTNLGVKAKLGAALSTGTSINGVAMHPDPAEGIIIACSGTETSGQLVRTTDNGVTWTLIRSANGKRHWIGFDAGDPNFVYQWNERSADKGATWTTLSMPTNAVIVGISATPYNGRSVLYAARIQPAQNPSPIWRSLDGGDTWQQVASPTWRLCSASDQQTTFRVHPTDPFTIFTRSPARQIRRWTFDAVGATVSTQDFDVFAGGPVPTVFNASNFAIDASHPDVMYLRSSQGGQPYTGQILYMTSDGGTTWTNISEGFSNSAGNGLEVHPTTGVVYIGTTNGMYVRKPPYPVSTPNNTFDLLKAAYPNWALSHVVADSAPKVVTHTLPVGRVEQPYSIMLTAAGGEGALVWSLDSGSLPEGLTLSPEGLITGTPRISGSSTFTVRVSDSDINGGVSDEGVASLTLTVDPAPTTITFTNLVQRYDGQPKSVNATSPSGSPIALTYNGSAAVPTLPGVYNVAASISSNTHVGNATDTFVVTITAQVRRAPIITSGLDGSAQVMTGEDLSLSGGSWIAGDLLLPGTPTVMKSGGANYLGQLEGPGSATPNNYAVRLSGGAVMHRIVHHVDPLTLPVVPTPALPTGTRNITLSSPYQTAGDFGTVRNLTLSGNVGAVAVPPGNYGTFVASGSSAFVFGTAGATEPAIYELRGLTVNTQVQVIGPVVLVVAGDVVVNGSGILGAAADPSLLTLMIAHGDLKAGGATKIYGEVVVPNGKISLSGSATLRGTVVADQLSITGGALLEDPEL